jgi:hypothetical protein
VAIAIASITLSREQVRLAGTNSVRPDAYVAPLEPGHPVCQRNVLLEKASAGLRVIVGTYHRPGPKLTLQASAPDVRVRSTAVGYADGSFATFLFPPLERAVRFESICFTVSGQPATLAGEPSPNGDPSSSVHSRGKPLPVDVVIQTVRAHKQSLADLAPVVFHRASLFRPGWVGPWTYWVLLLVVALLVIAAPVLLGLAGIRLSERWLLTAICVVAFLNAAVWSLVMPSFAPPDEGAHYGYVESLVERGSRPVNDPKTSLSSLSLGAATAEQFAGRTVSKGALGKPPWSQGEEHALNEDIRRLGEKADEGGGGYTTAAGYTPLYYGMEALPYEVARNGSVFSRIWMLRIGSALMAMGTAAFAFMLGREVAPSVRWFAATVALVVAFQPMFGFLGGAVNNDNLLFLLAAVELWLLVRILRRGVDLRLGITAGIVMALGIAAKPTMYAVVPPFVACLAWSLATSSRRREAANATFLALGAFGILLAARYLVFSGDEVVSAALDVNQSGAAPFSLTQFLSYTWQWYLPPLPSMHDLFLGYLPAYDVFFRGFWANFGHLDTSFPLRVYRWLLGLCVLVIALVGVTLYRERARWRLTLPFVALGLLLLVSLCLLVNYRSYEAFLGGSFFAQGRYLLPAVPILGATIGAAALALGRRYGVLLATAMVTALACFNAFCLGLVMFRFYT